MEDFYRGRQKSGPDAGKWVYGYVIKGINNCFIVNPKEYEEGYPTASTSTLVCASRIVDEETVGRAVGKKDKNGKDIFDGDILKVINGSINGLVLPYNIVVRWNDKESRWKVPLFEGAYEPTHNYEVIGNIYDNPELIDKKYEMYNIYDEPIESKTREGASKCASEVK